KFHFTSLCDRMESDNPSARPPPPPKDPHVPDSTVTAAAKNDGSNAETGGFGISRFARLKNGFGLRFPSTEENVSDNAAATAKGGGVLESFTKGLVDSSRSAMKAMQVKARHVVSQNKRRYQVAQAFPCCCPCF